MRITGLTQLQIFVLAVALTLSAGTLCAAIGQENFIDRSNDIKAAYLYNFGKYVSWPANNGNGTDDFVIGVVGSNPIGQALSRIASKKTISGRKIQIKLIEAAQDASSCELLYFPEGQDNPLFKPIVEAVHGRPNLLVGDRPGFASQGGMINFYTDENKVKFEINTEQAKRGGLSISSKLLRLGRSIDASTTNQ